MNIRLRVALVAGAVILIGVWAFSAFIQTPVLCTYAGSPYLDPGIPDQCEVGQPPQPE